MKRKINQNLRPYGPGKFDSMLDAAIYNIALDGVDEEAGSVSEVGLWAGLMRNGKEIADQIETEGLDATSTELQFLRTKGAGGVILTEDDRGFVDVSYHATETNLERSWNTIVEEIAVPEENPKRRSNIDEIAANELILYLENDAELYRRRTIPIMENLARKMARGTYDPKKAPKLWSNLVDDAAKKYAKEFGGTWNEIFDAPTRKYAANELARSFEAEVAAGEHEDLIRRVTPKSRRRNPEFKETKTKSGHLALIGDNQAAVRVSNPGGWVIVRSKKIVGQAKSKNEAQDILRGSRKPNPLSPRMRASLYAAGGSLAGTILGGLLIGRTGAWLGSIAGGAAGGFAGAASAVRTGGAIGGGLGGILTPIGAGVGTYIGTYQGNPVIRLQVSAKTEEEAERKARKFGRVLGVRQTERGYLVDVVERKNNIENKLKVKRNKRR